MTNVENFVVKLVMVVLFIFSLYLLLWGFKNGNLTIGIWNTLNAIGCLLVLNMADKGKNDE